MVDEWDELFGDIGDDDSDAGDESDGGDTEDDAEYPDDWYDLLDEVYGYEVFEIDISISYGEDT